MYANSFASQSLDIITETYSLSKKDGNVSNLSYIFQLTII